MARSHPLALLLASLLSLSCTSKTPIGGQCTFSDECDAPLVCAGSYCREACRTARDCADGRLCLPGTTAGARVCLPSGAERLCSMELDCPQGAQCASGRCYVRCVADADCLGGACVAGGRCAAPVTVSLSADAGVTPDAGSTPDAAADASTPDGGACPMTCPVTCGAGGRCLTVTDVSAGAAYTCAVLSDGSARCWGAQDVDTRVLGDGTVRPHPYPRAIRGVADAVEVATSMAQVCVRSAAGAVQCWGYDDGTPSAMAGLDARDLSATGEHQCVVRADGAAVCFGANDHGQLGDGTTTRSSAPVVARGASGPLSGVAQVAAGVRHTCARLVSGDVHCWGDDSDGQLGRNGAPGSRLTASATPALRGAVFIAAGEAHTCAIVEGGAVRCWGRDAEGQLGDGPGPERSEVPVAVLGEDGTPLRGVTSLGLGWLHSCAVGGDGSVRCWGRGDEGLRGSLLGGLVRAAVVAGLTATKVTGGRAHTCALVRDGALWCFGRNNEGQLGDEASARPAGLRVRDLVGVGQASAGARHTCAAAAGGIAWCWGADENHRLGDGAETDRGLAAQVPGAGDVRRVAAGGGNGCAVSTDGRLRCWGANDLGQVGDGMPEHRDRPSLVPLEGVADVSIGWVYVLARLADGTVRAWGANDFSQLGLGASSPEVVRSPTVVSSAMATLRDVRAVAAGTWMSCAVVGEGAVRCWGRAPSLGSLGDGTSMGRSLPTAVVGVTDAAEIGVGEAHACTRSRDGAVRCWGWNDGGQAGNGGTEVTLTATPVLTEEGSPMTGVTELAVGGAHGCARTGASELRCWGWNQYGQLGDGTRSSRTRAVRVPGMDGMRGVTAGAWHTCVVQTDGSMRCWGRDTEGQLGDGASSRRMVPVRTHW